MSVAHENETIEIFNTFCDFKAINALNKDSQTHKCRRKNFWIQKNERKKPQNLHHDKLMNEKPGLKWLKHKWDFLSLLQAFIVISDVKKSLKCEHNNNKLLYAVMHNVIDHKITINHYGDKEERD
mgnify:CR=1 FL=1